MPPLALQNRIHHQVVVHIRTALVVPKSRAASWASAGGLLCLLDRRYAFACQVLHQLLGFVGTDFDPFLEPLIPPSPRQVGHSFAFDEDEGAILDWLDMQRPVGLPSVELHYRTPWASRRMARLVKLDPPTWRPF